MIKTTTSILILLSFSLAGQWHFKPLGQNMPACPQFATTNFSFPEATTLFIDNFIKEGSSKCLESAVEDACQVAKPFVKPSGNLWASMCALNVRNVVKACPRPFAFALVGMYGLNALKCADR